jgi:peroxiredoxin
MASGFSASDERDQLGTERSLAQSHIERDGIKPGTKAPVFSLPDLDGRVRSLDEYRGRRVLLVFSDPDCGPCDALAPDLVKLQKERPDLRLIMVSRGDVAANREKARFNGFPFPVVIQDGWKLSKEYGIFATPVAFLIDRNGFIAKPVGIGAAQILALVDTGENQIVPRWRALWPIAAAFAGGLFAGPLRAIAQPTCPAGQTNCAGTCANLANDRTNCGACGKTCPAGSVCASGMCIVTCAAGQVNCAGQCVNPANDSANCGSCGRMCPPGAVCVQGVCVVTCAAGQANCAGRCAEVSRDPQNCGACGRVCPAGSLCVNGVCVSPPCPAGQINCAGMCVNLTNDSHNCGACGKVCAAGSVCVNGVCVAPPCPQGQVRCGPVCANLASDPANCGACGKMCPPGAVCVQGVCVVTCPPGQVNCAGTCTNVTYDPKNCGACGKKCPTGWVCYNGKCVKLCA